MSIETEFTISNELLNPTSQTCPAVTRCCDAWNSAFKSEKSRRDPYGSELDLARVAFRRAMPPLIGYENIRDFIACVAQGVLLGAISESQSTRLLYAVQVAQSALRLRTGRTPSV